MTLDQCEWQDGLILEIKEKNVDRTIRPTECNVCLAVLTYEEEIME